MTDDKVWHYVRPNETTRIPRRHIFMDTESRSERTSTGHRQSWRLGAAAYRVADKGRPIRNHLTRYSDPLALWQDVSVFAKPRNRTVLWAHNLPYDLRIADAFGALPALGWKLDAHNLANRGAWLSWSKNGATLVMADATSVFPVPLSEIAKSFMQAKMSLPEDNATTEDWYTYCVRDVEILRDAIVAYLDWLEAEDMGSWQLTGAGQSYAAFRHKHLTHPMLVHTDAAALQAEREAMWAGRCEAYWRGRTAHVGIEEWDLSLAYPRLAATHDLPTQFIGPVAASQDVLSMLDRPRTAILARVRIETDVPVVPARHDDRILWPVGRFDTTLWSPEISLALSAGAKVTVLEAWRYHTTPALKQWAESIIDALREDNPRTLPFQRIIHKHHGRALIGRFGMQYSKWARFGSTDHHDVLMSTVYDTTTGEEYELTHLGEAVMRQDGVADWSQGMPAITSYIMSLSRVQLWQLIQTMPPKSVLYVDTDAFYVTAEHHDDAYALSRTPLGAGLRLKTSYLRAEILGPRQIFVDGRPRIAGIPRKAVRMADSSLVGEVWASLDSSLRRGQSDVVITTDRTWKVSGIDRRRTGGPTGWTQPIRLGGG